MTVGLRKGFMKSTPSEWGRQFDDVVKNLDGLVVALSSTKSGADQCPTLRRLSTAGDRSHTPG